MPGFTPGAKSAFLATRQALGELYSRLRMKTQIADGEHPTAAQLGRRGKQGGRKPPPSGNTLIFTMKNSHLLE
jgi:hypothetical protein